MDIKRLKFYHHASEFCFRLVVLGISFFILDSVGIIAVNFKFLVGVVIGLILFYFIPYMFRFLGE